MEQPLEEVLNEMWV